MAWHTKTVLTLGSTFSKPNSQHIGGAEAAAALSPRRLLWGVELSTSEAWWCWRDGTGHRSSHYQRTEEAVVVLAWWGCGPWPWQRAAGVEESDDARMDRRLPFRDALSQDQREEAEEEGCPTCRRSLLRCRDALWISHRNPPRCSHLAHRSHRQDKALVSEGRALVVEVDSQACDLWREALACPSGTEGGNNLLCLAAEVDIPLPLVHEVCF